MFIKLSLLVCFVSVLAFSLVRHSIEDGTNSPLSFLSVFPLSFPSYSLSLFSLLSLCPPPKSLLITLTEFGLTQQGIKW